MTTKDSVSGLPVVSLKTMLKFDKRQTLKTAINTTWIPATRLVIAALYKYLDEKMKLLWNESMKMNTVHVDDVVASAFALAQNQVANGQCYNLVDDSQSTQGSISNILANIFNIKVDYWGEGLTNLSKVSTVTI